MISILLKKVTDHKEAVMLGYYNSKYDFLYKKFLLQYLKDCSYCLTIKIIIKPSKYVSLRM